MLFNQINIYGWEEIEPVILAAIVSELPVLLIGDIGSNKTEGSEAISRALLGAKIDFRAYEVPTLNFDDLIGFMNPKSLARGELDFVHTPLSIWKADAVLFDEINRANLVKYLSIQFVLKTLINEDAPATRIYSLAKEIVASI